MTDNLTGPELFADSAGHLTDITEGDAEYTSASGVRVDNRMLYATIATASAAQAQTAALVMLTEVIASATDTFHYDLAAWREVIPRVPLKECRSKHTRRPECADRHTDDCDYTDPVPEPEHVLLPVGTRVLVSNPHDTNCDCSNAQPWVGKIAGYDLHRSKYQVNEELHYDPGTYYNHVRWVFADNRVQPLHEEN